MRAGRRALRCAVLLALLLLGACSGWSSWENSKRPSASGRAHRNAPASREAAPSSALSSAQYRVASGDTLYSIAFRNNLDYRELARWNGIGSDYRIYVGQLLRLRADPGARETAAAAPASAPERTRPLPMPEPIVPRPVPLPGAVAETPAIPATAPVPALKPAPEPESMPELGSYQWTWPTLGTVTRGYGQDGSKGLDLSGQLGQPVFAAAPGRVVYSGNALKGYGELIIIKHDETFLSAYGYNRLRHVKEGDIVTTGQPIGELGLGPENQPMLHFEIRNKGQPIDPLGKLPKR